MMDQTAWCVCGIHSSLLSFDYLLIPDQRGPCISSTLEFLSRLNGDSFPLTQSAGAAQELSDAAFFIFTQTSLLCFCFGLAFGNAHCQIKSLM